MCRKSREGAQARPPGERARMEPGVATEQPCSPGKAQHGPGDHKVATEGGGTYLEVSEARVSGGPVSLSHMMGDG